jgi:hypothetical protein
MKGTCHRLVWIIVIGILISLFPGCQSDRNEAVNRTMNRLDNMGQVIVKLWEGEYDFAKCDSYETLVDEATKRAFLEPDKYTYDSWGHRYALMIRFHEHRIVIRISSFGKDGIDETGDGDDLFVEVTIWPEDGQSPKRAEITTVRRAVELNGEPVLSTERTSIER